MVLSNKAPELNDIERITSALEILLETHEVPLEVGMGMSVVIDEVYSNIVYYSGATNAIVECEVTDAHIKLCFIDNGMPYNPLTKEDPNVTGNLKDREVGGWGIYLVKQFVEDMAYARVNDCNRLELLTAISEQG